MEALLAKPVVVTLALLGAALSVAASTIGKAHAKWLNRAGYAAMAASMLLFIIAGLRGAQS